MDHGTRQRGTVGVADWGHTFTIHKVIPGGVRINFGYGKRLIPLIRKGAAKQDASSPSDSQLASISLYHCSVRAKLDVYVVSEQCRRVLSAIAIEKSVFEFWYDIHAKSSISE